jgi:hypothetical protein
MIIFTGHSTSSSKPKTKAILYAGEGVPSSTVMRPPVRPWFPKGLPRLFYHTPTRHGIARKDRPNQPARNKTSHYVTQQARIKLSASLWRNKTKMMIFTKLYNLFITNSL